MRTLACMIAGLVALPALAGALERGLEARWRGAWVVVGVETASACDALFTDNRVHGRYATSRGRHRFDAGELARVVDVDVHRSRIDVRLELDEPLRFSWREGPFTLYRHETCRIELEVEVPRRAIRSREVESLDEALLGVMARFDSATEAGASEAWNGRLSEPFPENYGRTLARWRHWKAERHNESVAGRIARAEDGLRGLGREIRTDSVWTAGFAEGVASRRDAGQLTCVSLAGGGSLVRAVSRDAVPEGEAEADAWRAGHAAGQRLVEWLDVLDRGEACYVPLPEAPPAAEARRDEPGP